MGWCGYETTCHNQTRIPICQVVLDLFDASPGEAAVSLRRLRQSGGSIQERPRGELHRSRVRPASYNPEDSDH